MWREGGWMRIAQVSTDAQGWQPPHSDAGLLLHLRPLVRCKALKRKRQSSLRIMNLGDRI